MIPIRDTAWLLIALTALSVAVGLVLKVLLRAPHPLNQTPTAAQQTIRTTIQLPPHPDAMTDGGDLAIELDETYLSRPPEEWERLLQHPDASKRVYAITTLARQGGRFIPLCLWALDDSDTSVRIAALKALDAMGTIAAPAADAIIDAVRYDPSLEVRLHAINALGSMGPGAERAVATLRKLL